MSSISPEQYRAICFEEHGRECDVCGVDSGVIVHHIDGDRSNNTSANLLPVCRKHHMKIHHNSSGFEEWHEKLLPPSQRTLMPDDEHYVPVDEPTERMLYEIKDGWDTGTIGNVVWHSLRHCTRFDRDVGRTDITEPSTEVLVKPAWEDMLEEFMEKYGFDEESEAVKNAITCLWDDKYNI